MEEMVMDIVLDKCFIFDSFMIVVMTRDGGDTTTAERPFQILFGAKIIVDSKVDNARSRPCDQIASRNDDLANWSCRLGL